MKGSIFFDGNSDSCPTTPYFIINGWEIRFFYLPNSRFKVCSIYHTKTAFKLDAIQILRYEDCSSEEFLKLLNQINTL